MNLQVVIQIGALVSVIVGLVSFINGIRAIHRQMTLQILMKYTERYERVMDSFPERASGFRQDESMLPERTIALSVSVVKYLNLCSEEYYLKRKKYLARDVWEIWEEEMNRMIASPLIRREWEFIHQEFESHREFADYVKDVHEGNHEKERKWMP